MDYSEAISIDGSSLNVQDCISVARDQQPAQLTENQEILTRIQKAFECVEQAVAENRGIYGVTTLFGGLANNGVNHEQASDLQRHLILAHHAGVGEHLPDKDIRATMLIR